MSAYPVYVAASKTQKLAYPHHSDERWRTAQLIFGSECTCDNSNYSDRLWEWDRDAAQRGEAAWAEFGDTSRTAHKWEAYLSAYHERAVDVRYIMAGVNLATGFAYYFIGYDWVS